MQDGHGRHTAPLVANAAVRFVETAVNIKWKLSDLSLVVAAQTGSSLVNWVQDSRCRCRGVAGLAGVVGAPLVIFGYGRLTLHPVAGTTVLSPSERVGETRGAGHQGIG